jgi:mRNA-degrading endonuclease YafQ of YafQ-DinJ toxin-antitoxin module
LPGYRNVASISRLQGKYLAYIVHFRRDYRREKSGRHGSHLDALLMEVVNLLADDMPLPHRTFDHSSPK